VKSRVGIGYDAHRFAAGRELVLGGVLIPESPGLAGHSDADVLTHAIMDALLGAAGLPDIGTLFPDTDERFAGADSVRLLREVVTMVRERGWGIANVDAVLVCETPRLAPHKDAVRASLADVLSVETAQVGVKGTTTEGMGFEGRREGIGATAVCLLVEDDERVL